VPLFQHYFDYSLAQEMDLVYTWVNGSESSHINALSRYLRTHNISSNAATPDINHQNVNEDVASYRYSASKDELLYSLRSVEKYMNWYRHIYIVTSGQVPTFINTSHPRITIIPHATIFPNHSHLPTFNSVSVEAHLHRIPGLSEYFLYMNDDWFLLQHMYPYDFVTPDGYSVIPLEYPLLPCRTDTELAGDPVEAQRQHGCIPAPYTFLDMLRHIDNIYTHRYNDTRQRYVIAHTTTLFSCSLIQRMQHEYAIYWNETSSHAIRSPRDMLLAFAMRYWEIHKHYAYTITDHRKHRTTSFSDQDVSDVTDYLNQLWHDPLQFKTVCLNDQAVDPINVELIGQATKQFMEQQYPQPSPYELKYGYRYHVCNNIHTQYQEVPTKEQMRDACH
jgi:hypothetical protein